jgi:hypothetical protein
VRDQYVGDISDLLKLSLLRQLAENDHALGVGWYYNPQNDGRPDGRRREYRDETKWDVLGSSVRQLLGAVQPSVQAFEESPLWPVNTRFHRKPIPVRGDRLSWAQEMSEALNGCRIVFLDPDNGIGQTAKHCTFDEVAAIRRPGRAVVLIKFPAHRKHTLQLEQYHRDLLANTRCLSLLTLRISVHLKQPSIRWFTILDGNDELCARAERFGALLNTIEGCKCETACFSCARPDSGRSDAHPATSDPLRKSGKAVGTPLDRIRKVCPECGYIFQGNGFDGIDAHWRARHESIAPYAVAWPLIKSGRYGHKELAAE